MQDFLLWLPITGHVPYGFKKKQNGFCFPSYVHIYQIPHAALGPRLGLLVQRIKLRVRNRGSPFLSSVVLMNE
jgi:hypothetical protein